MNKIAMLACWMYTFGILALEDAERWCIIKAHEAAKRDQVADNEGDAVVRNDLRSYVECKHKARTRVLEVGEKREQQRLKKLLVEDGALAADDGDENYEDVMLCPRGIWLLGNRNE